MADNNNDTSNPFTKEQEEQILSFLNEKLKSGKRYTTKMEPYERDGDTWIRIDVHKNGEFYVPAYNFPISLHYAEHGYSKWYRDWKSKSKLPEWPDSQALAEFLAFALTRDQPPYWTKIINPDLRKAELEKVKLEQKDLV